MYRLYILAALLGVAGSANAAALTHGSVGAGRGLAIPGRDSNPCNGTLMLNYDGSAENAYCWQYTGVQAPYYGAFAECYSGCGRVCGIELILTGIGYPCCTSDLYVWDDANGAPGNVICMTPAVNPCPVALWPSVSTHDFALNGGGCCVGDRWWVGLWVNTPPDQPCCYYVAADLDGFGGCPFTNVSPNAGYGTPGWQNVSNIWGPTQSLGIGAWLVANDPSCCVSPTKESTWGAIKSLYQ